MNSVENITANLFPALGTASVDVTAPPIQTGDISVDGVQEFLGGFAGQIDALAPSVAAANGIFNPQQATAYSELQQLGNSGLAAAPTDTSLLIDPTATDGKSVLVSSMKNAGGFFPTFEEDDQITSPLNGIEGFEDSLSVGFTATTQGLSNFEQSLPTATAGLQTKVDSSLPAPFSPVPTITELANTNSLTQVRGAGHLLPVAELSNLHAAATNNPTGETAQAALSSAVNANSAEALPRTTLTGAPIDTSGLTQTLTASSETPNGLTTFANEALKQAESLQLGRAANAQAQSEVQARTGNTENIIDENIDADGQVLNVLQKSRENSFVANQLMQNQTNTQPTAATQVAATTAAAATVTPQSVDNASARSAPITEKRDALNISAPTDTSINARTNIDQIAPAQRTAVDWSSPWSGTWTPERAAGLTEGFGTDLIAGGLTGLKGEGTGLLGMGLMGGKPNAELGGHIAKQLNVNVTRAVKAGESEFAMRMDPPELGKVMVKIKFGADGIVRANVFVERPETLELLQRETRGLERAIEAGGGKAEEGGITFTLDSGGEESAGKAFAEAVQEDRLREAIRQGDENDSPVDERAPDDLTETIDLEEILAHVTPESGLDVRV